MMAPVGYYHVHAQSADGGKTGLYMITQSQVDPADQEKFQAFVEWHANRMRQSSASSAASDVTRQLL